MQESINADNEQLNQSQMIIDDCKRNIGSLNGVHTKLTQQLNEKLNGIKEIQNNIAHLENVVDKKITVTKKSIINLIIRK